MIQYHSSFFDIPLSHFFFFNATATTEIYTLSLHDALPISPAPGGVGYVHVSKGTIAHGSPTRDRAVASPSRSEEHTSELQSRFDLVCRLLLEKKKKQNEPDQSKCYLYNIN